MCRAYNLIISFKKSFDDMCDKIPISMACSVKISNIVPLTLQADTN